MMDRHRQAEGFTLLELCLVIFVISLLSTIFTKSAAVPDTEFKVFPYRYLYLQSKAIAEAQSVVYEDPNGSVNEEIVFNSKGNINSARTIQFVHNGIIKTVIIELGGGRLVFP